MSNVLIQIKELCKTYGNVPVIQNMNLDIFEGEVFGLIGPNGAGKSTLLSMIATLSRPTSGDILIQGKSVLAQSDSIKKMIVYKTGSVILLSIIPGE